MRWRHALLLGGASALLGGCDGALVDPPPQVEPACVEDVMIRTGCTGCHGGDTPSAGLDLASPGRAARLVGAPAGHADCNGRLLIDPDRPERSLLLQAVGAVAPPGGALDTCRLVMPPGQQAPLPAEAQACLVDWVDGLAAAPPDDFEPTPVGGALARVKTLVDGRAPTADELLRVDEDPAALRTLLEEWTDLERNPRFARVLGDFLAVALQQRLETITQDQFDGLRGHRSRRRQARAVLEESFVRTAVDIVARGAPFTEVLTTDRWMMTTANLVLLRYTELTAAERAERHALMPAGEGAPTLEEQVAARSWAVPGLPEDGSQCGRGNDAADTLDLLFGFLRGQCTGGENLLFEETALTDADFEDWRPVVLSRDQADGAPIPFYDIPALRAVDGVLRVRQPRSGFFTTPAFFANWPTNVDNQFRVTTNQTVLAALHGGFTQTEPTERATDDDAAIPLEHTEGVDSACYGCHKNMDPMRIYFARTYTVDYQRPFAESGAPGGPIYEPMPRSGFALFGVRETDGNVRALGRVLAEHPRFAVAWVQKACLFATAARCDEDDPEFERIVDRFRDGHDLRAMLVDLLASPLVTGLAPTDSRPEEGPPIGITRRDHLCAALDARTGVDGVCELGRVNRLIRLVPRDAFVRGIADPSQPALPSAFHFAAVRALCEAIAPVVVSRSPYIDHRAPDAAIDAIVERLLGLTPAHPRHAAVRAALRAHFDTLRAEPHALDRHDAIGSTFALACTSPDLMGMGL